MGEGKTECFVMDDGGAEGWMSDIYRRACHRAARNLANNYARRTANTHKLTRNIGHSSEINGIRERLEERSVFFLMGMKRKSKRRGM